MDSTILTGVDTTGSRPFEIALRTNKDVKYDGDAGFTCIEVKPILILSTDGRDRDGDVFNTFDPDPVEVVTPVPPFETGSMLVVAFII